LPVPDFQSLMRPLLVALEDGGEHPVEAIRASLVDQFALTPADVEELIPSGRVTKFQNRVGWATTYLYRTGLIERPERAVYRLTERGRDVLRQATDRVDLRTLAQFAEFNEFRQAKTPPSGDVGVQSHPDSENLTPEEQIDGAYREMSSALSAELLDRVLEKSPTFFEQLVLDVLHEMGYGGSRDDATQRLGQSGDEGIDGIIREDRLGLDLIYVQAKRWTKVVGRPEIQKFFGALHGKRATKGVFITTSTFSRAAIEYGEGVTPRVVLVNGKELAQLMIEHGVGVTSSRAYEIKRIDLDYFTNDEESSSAVDGGEQRARLALPR
jgi:restriction system protein